MAAKPMPRLRAGISGSPLITSAKRSLSLHVKSSSDSRTSSRHSSAAGGSLRKEASLQVKKLKLKDDALSTLDTSKFSTKQQDDSADSTDYQSSWDKMCKQIEISAKGPELEHIALSFDQTISNNSDQELQLSRLKDLMQLQNLLIGRQQELLKQRDKEVQQLKTKAQSYKNRLDRMERRIMLLRRQSDVLNPTSNYRRNVKSSKTDLRLDNQVEASRFKFDTDNSAAIAETTDLPCGNYVPNRNSSQATDRRYKLFGQSLKTCSVSTNTALSFLSSASSVESDCTDDVSSTSPIEQLRNDQSSFISNRNSMAQPQVIKACDHCPTCAAIVKESKTEISVTGVVNAISTVINNDVAKQQTPEIQLQPESTTIISLAEPTCTDEVILEANYPYHLITWPRDDQSYPYTDLDFSFEEGSTLNIPTWKINKLTPLTGNVPTPSKEVADDEAFFKRHSRLEIGEKRRKRWDFQRIREYRYNEKLRQKHLKHNRDQYLLDTFSPSLSDIDALQVEETLPINFFGHSLERLQREEFTLVNES